MNEQSRRVCAVILAAGDGKRMKSDRPKALCEVLFKPMLKWVEDACRAAGIDEIWVVTGANALLQGTAMLTLADETREMEGGLILRDGNVEVNCAFETQLRVLRETMAADIAAILFA